MFRSCDNRLLAALGRAAAWTKAFALLEDEPRTVAPHPHRAALAAPPRERRPGVVAERPQVCVSPIGANRAPARAQSDERAARRAARH